MSKKCIQCGAEHSPLDKWHEIEHDVPDGFGMACSEPGVPTTVTIKSHMCDPCNDKLCEEEFEAYGMAGEGDWA